MKKIYSLLFVITLFIAKNSNGQTFSNTCSTPYPINSVTNYSYSTVTGVPNTDLTNDYGCIAPADNATWFYFQACMSGNVDIVFASYTSSSSDIDFIAYGPLSAPTDCGLSSSQIVDCSNASGTWDTLNINSVVVGSYYKILVSNPSGTVGTYNFSALNIFPFFYDSCMSCMDPLPFQEVCQVTTDPVQNRNIIIWEKDTTYTNSYIIQKESTTMGVYTTIATVMNNDTSAYIDSTSNPMIQAFRYRIGTTDTCGNTNFSSMDHQTIHLLTSVSSSTGYPQLAWSSYIGFGYYTYYIFRGSSPTTLTLYDSISASFNSYTDVAAVPGMNYYSVSVLPPVPCQPSRAMNMYSLSNVSPVAFTGINEYEFNQLTVGPNPANETLNFSLGNIATDITIDIIDITGRVIQSKTFENVNKDFVSLNGISNGSYIVRFATKNTTSYRNIVIAK